MNNNTTKLLGIVLCLALAAPVALADAPKSLKQPDAHSIEAKGTVTVFRVQAQGMGLGSGKDKLDAEVFVTIDSEPNIVFSLQLQDKSPRANAMMAEMLRESFLTKTPVTIYHQIAPGSQPYGKILMVQFGR